MATKSTKSQAATDAEELDALAAVVETWRKRDVQIERQGQKITLPAIPEDMPIPAAIEALNRLLEEENQKMNAFEIIDAFPTDAAHAFMLAMQELYGWASPVPTPGFFGSTPPTMMTIKTGPKPADSIQVPVGSFKIPGVGRPVRVTPHVDKGRAVFVIHGEFKKKEVSVVKKLADKTREILRTKSIYKGKAIKIESTTNSFDMENPPTFMEVDHVKPEELILNKDTQSLLDVSVFTPIRHTETCIKHKIPLKRGILLEGKYGCGKTLIATITSKVCVENGWTFITVEHPSMLEQALDFARRYEPAVVFSEDLDRFAETRNDKANDLLNTIDGILSKNAKIITVLTTNHVERINNAMLRPGRLDAVISVSPPNAETVGKLITVYSRGLLAEGEDLTPVGKVLAGQIPATIREVTERAKLAMINRGGENLTSEDLRIVAVGMKNHLDLLNAEKPKQPVGLEAAFAQIVEMNANKAVTNNETIQDVRDYLLGN